jgi:hypothetical protein
VHQVGETATAIAMVRLSVPAQDVKIASANILLAPGIPARSPSRRKATLTAR